MIKLAIVFFSATGTTARLADAFKSGASAIADAKLYRIVGDNIIAGRFDNEELMLSIDSADGVAFGSPTYMGGPAAQFKAFADATSERWNQQLWANKVAAGFTTGACPSGDQLHTLTYFSIFAAQHGMLWCGLDIPGGDGSNGLNRLGSQLGLATHMVANALPKSDLRSAEYLGSRLAQLASRNVS